MEKVIKRYIYWAIEWSDGSSYFSFTDLLWNLYLRSSAATMSSNKMYLAFGSNPDTLNFIWGNICLERKVKNSCCWFISILIVCVVVVQFSFIKTPGRLEVFLQGSCSSLNEFLNFTGSNHTVPIRWMEKWKWAERKSPFLKNQFESNRISIWSFQVVLTLHSGQKSYF